MTSKSILAHRITTRELCRILAKSRQTIWRMVKEGRLPPPERIEGFSENLWTEPVIAEWLEANLREYPHAPNPDSRAAA